MQKLKVPYCEQQKVNHLMSMSWQFVLFMEVTLDQHNLHMQLTLLGMLFDGLNKDSIEIPFVINQLRELTQPLKNLFSEVIVFIKLLSLAPAKNAVSERSCSEKN